jgi:hypothetical protein
MLTRLGEAGVDAFTIVRIAGHSTIVISPRYAHPSPEFVENAFERFENLNRRMELVVAEKESTRRLPATDSATSEAPKVVAVQ